MWRPLQDGQTPRPLQEKATTNLGGFAPLEPAFEVLGDDLVERRLLGPTPLVAAGRRGAAMWPASDSPRKPCDRGDHGWTGRSTLVIDTGSIHGGRSAPTQPNRTLGPRDPYPEAYPDAAELLPSSELATRLSPSSREGCLLV